MSRPWNASDDPHTPHRADDHRYDAPRAPSATTGDAPWAPPYPYAVVDPSAPFGRTPTGQPYSERSKVVAGLLQIFLPGLGVGRFHLGHTRTGALQLGLTVAGCAVYGLAFAGLLLSMARIEDSGAVPGPTFLAPFAVAGVSFLLLGAAALWTLIDGILILCDRVSDAEGRPLRA